MKKTYFNPANPGMAMKINSRQTRFGSAAFRSDGNKKIKLSTDGLEGANKAFVEKLNEEFGKIDVLDEDAVKSVVMSICKGMFKEDGDLTVDFTKLAGLYDLTMGEGETSLKSIMKRQGDIINAMKELQSAAPTRVKTIRDQIKDFHEANKDKLKAFLSGESKSFGTRIGANGEMEAGIDIIKAPATITVAGSSNGSAFVPTPEIVPGLIDLNRNRPFIEQYSNVTGTNRSRIVYTEKTNPQGQAAWLAEGGVKPLISFEWISRESYAKKVADKIKVSTESLEDVDWMAAEIEAELKYQVDIAVDDALLAGTGDGTSSAVEPKGLTEYAGGYVLTQIQTATPNNFDAIRAAIAQIVSLNFYPDYVFLNPIDGANMDLVKDDQGRPLAMEYRDGSGKLWRVQPVETNQMPIGYFLLGDMSRFRVRNYKPFAVYYGWVNDDFEKNLVTVIGERRLHDYVYTNDTGAFVYDSFANVKTAITAP